MNEPKAFVDQRPWYYMLFGVELVYLIVGICNVYIIAHSMLYIISYFDRVDIPYITAAPMPQGPTPAPTPIPKPVGDEDKTKLKQIKKDFQKLYFEYLTKAENHDFLTTNPPYYSDYFNSSVTLLELLPTLYIMEFKKDLNRKLKKLDFTQMKFPSSFSRSDFVSQILSPLLSLYDMSHFTDVTTHLSNIFKFFTYATNSNAVADRMVTDFQGIAIHSDDPIMEAHMVGSTQLEYLAFHKFFKDQKIYDIMLGPFVTFFEGQTSGFIADTANAQNQTVFEGSYSISKNGRSYLDYFLKLHLMTNESSRNLFTRFNNYYQEAEKLKLVYNNFFLRMKDTKVLDEVLIDEAFLPGMEILSNLDNRKRADDILNAYLSIRNTNKFGLFPQKVSVQNGMKILDGKVVFPIRLMESLYIMYKKTHDNKYREIAWEIHTNYIKNIYSSKGFQNLEISLDGKELKQIDGPVDPKICGGYFTYLYLLFSDSSIFPIRDWTFTWNGHPLRNVKKIRGFDARLARIDNFFFLM